ncbi:MAG: SDR family NAD(P)-dependent oxidoreductase, partial [Proteobacteria bacterium]|nr:SDR family NAD(P)-dependent oxidoreductase [Pseudomonadota bacterium]
SLEDALSVLAGKKDIKAITFSRPSIPFHDPVNNEVYLPLRFSKAYLKHLLADINLYDSASFEDGKPDDRSFHGLNKDIQETLIGNLLIAEGILVKDQLEEVLDVQAGTNKMLGLIAIQKGFCSDSELASVLKQQEQLRNRFRRALGFYIKKAQTLYSSNFTFKKYLEQWNSILQRSVGLKIEELLFNIDSEFDGKREKGATVLMMVIIMCSIKRLIQNWELSENKLFQDSKFFELTDLVFDGVVRQETLVELLCVDNPDFESIAKALNEQQHLLDRTRPYQHIAKQCTKLVEIVDVSGWIKQALLTPVSFSGLAKEKNYLGLGRFTISPNGENFLHVTLNGSDEFNPERILPALWQKGVEIQWDRLFPEGTFRKVALPFYEFDTKSFWLPKTDRQQDENTNIEYHFKYSDDQAPSITTNLKGNSGNKWLRENRCFKRRYSIKEPIVGNHVICGKAIIPGADYLETARYAIRSLSKEPNASAELQNIVFHSPGVVHQELDVELDVSESGDRFVISGNGRQLCSGAYKSAAIKEHQPTDFLINTNQEPLESKTLYSKLQSVGYEYGESLRVIERVWRTQSGYLFEIKKEKNKEQGYSELDPYLLDGVLQTLLAFLFYKNEWSVSSHIYIPHLIKSIRIFNEMTDPCYVSVDENKIDWTEGGIVGNLTVFNPLGKILNQLKGVAFKRIERSLFLRSVYDQRKNEYPAGISEKTVYYQPIWHQQSLPTNANSIHSQSEHRDLSVLIVLQNTEFQWQQCDKLKSYFSNVIAVRSANSYQKISPEKYEINPKKISDYNMLFDEILSIISDSTEPLTLFNFWPYDFVANDVSDLNSLSEKQERGVLRFLILVKALARRFKSRKINIMIASFNSQVIVNDDLGLGFGYGGLTGFCQSLKQEYPNLDVRLVDFDEHGGRFSQTSMILVKELNNPTSKDVVGYRQGMRYIREFERINIDEKIAGSSSTLKENGIYLLAGGSSSLGSHLVEWLLKNKAGHLVLVGRSPEWENKVNSALYSTETAQKIQYIQADVTDHDQMIQVIGRIRKQFHRIDGVFQCCGVLDDKLIENKDLDAVNLVLAPKVQGSWVLNDVTRNESLDFFVMFSSVVSVLGNIGQAEYAAANSFLDGFGHYRSKNNFPGKSLSIDWTLWASGGLGQAASIQKKFEAKSGVLSTSAGLTALNRLLNSDLQQCVVTGRSVSFDSERKSGKKNLNDENSDRNKNETPYELKNEPSKTSLNTIKLKEHIQLLLLKLLAEILFIEPAQLDIDIDIRDFSLDSIALSEYSDKINDVLEVEFNSALLFQYSNVGDIAEYLINQAPERTKEYVELSLKSEEENNLILESNSPRENSSKLQDQITNSMGKQATISNETKYEDQSIQNTDGCDQLTDIERAELTDNFVDSGVDQTKAQVENQLQKLLAEVLYVESAHIDIEVDIKEFALDSIALTEYAEKINEVFEIEFNASLLFQYSNICEIAEHVVQYRLQHSKGQFRGVQEAVNQANASIHLPATDENKNENQLSPVKDSGSKTCLNSDGIAIVGMSGQFPGSPDLESFWRSLIEEKSLVTEIPADRWQWEEFFGDPKGDNNKTNCKWGGFLPDIKGFDASFFGISPREAEKMDPQQRLLLMEVWRAIENAGIRPSQLSGTKTGVFVGVCNDDFNELLSVSNNRHDAFSSTGTYFSIIANRISFFLNTKGPSVAVDTACSSSLVAVHQAVQAINSGECSLALAGGVNVCLTPKRFISFSHAGLLSSDGLCRSFDKKANGYVRAEAVGVILLKKLSSAIKDNNTIFGIIRASAINHDGRSNFLTAPDATSQAELVSSAYKSVSVDPTTIGYIETHGTGTALGDSIEINGLKMAFEKMYKDFGAEAPSRAHCGLGSVKTNIGHAESAAGITGIIKVLLALRNKKIPATINFHEINPNVTLEGSPFYIVDKNQEWKTYKDKNNNPCPRLAGVSAFGFGGTNAHVLLEEYKPLKEVNQDIDENRIHLIVLSAKKPDRLNLMASRLANYIKANSYDPSFSLSNIAYTLQVGREPMEERLVILASDIHELMRKLRAFQEQNVNSSDIYRGRTAKETKKTKTPEEKKDERERQIALILENKINEIAKLWVSGVQIDWKLFYSGQKPQCLLLPTYPFAKEIHWSPEMDSKYYRNRANLSKQVGSIHPLLQRNSSTFSEITFSSTFTGEEFFFSDHIIEDSSVLPGVAGLEMAYSAYVQAIGSLSKNSSSVRLKNLVWILPLVVGKNVPEINIGLFSGENSQVNFNIYSDSKGNGSKQIIYSQGLVETGRVFKPQFIAIESIRSSCNQKILSSTQCYQFFDSINVKYGPAFKGIEEIFVGTDQLLAKLFLPSKVADSQTQFTIHPSILDSAFQACIGFLINSDIQNPILPFALEQLEVMDSCTPEMWALIRYSDSKSLKHQTPKFDIELCDNEGLICMRIKGLTFRVIGEENNSVKAPDFSKTLIAQPYWQEAALNEEKQLPDIIQHVVFTCEINEEIVLDKIKGQFNEQFHLKLEPKQSAIEDRFTSYAAKIFKKIKTILRSNPRKDVLVQLVIHNQAEDKIFSGFIGMLRTAQLENPRFKGQLIEVENDLDGEALVKILQDNRRRLDDQHIRYENGIRKILCLREIENLPNEANIPWKEQGVYLITGGVGGLGLIFAKEIGNTIDSGTVVLTGRSEICPEVQSLLNELSRSSLNVKYVPADVTNKKDVYLLLQSILKDFGRLDGIIHSAGVIRDNYILKKTEKELKDVLAPKVSGLVNLDEAGKDI